MPGDTMAIYGIRQEHVRICSLYFKAHIQVQQRSLCICITQSVCLYHAGPGVFSNERIPEDLGQSAHPERNVVAVPSQRTNALLQNT